MNLDLVIVASFLIINLGVGLYYGRGIKTIKEYAIGNRDFSTATIAATIIATWISGSDFAVGISETYREGVWYLVAGAGDIFALLIIGCVFGPRMQEFFGSLSVAEAMGNLFGKNVRIITAICAIAQGTGQIALQIKIFSTIFSHFLKFSSISATLISSFIVIIYSAWGGIKAVTFTDVIQFFTFGIFIPMFAIFIWQIFGDFESTFESMRNNSLFDFHQLHDTTNEKFWPYFFLLLYFSIPSLNSTMFQRTLMAKNTTQIKRSFAIAAIVALIVHLFACFIGLITLSYNSTLDPNNIVMYVIDNYSFTGLKGITLIGIMAMIMSTADSWINTSSVIFSHDFCKPLGVQVKNELLISRIFSIIIGTVAVFLALSAASLLKLLLLSANFYKPIVTVPLILAILGFRSSTKAVLIGMISGGTSAFIWKTFLTPSTGIDSVIPAMAMNLVAYIGSHYLLSQPGGWIKAEEGQELKESRRQRKNRNKAFSSSIEQLPNFSLVRYCQARLPKNPIVYSYFAFSTLLTIIVTFSINKTIYQQNSFLINLLQIFSLFISTIFICRNLLFSTKFQEKYWGIIWYSAIFISFAFISSLLVLISKFSQVAVVIFILNLTMIGMLLSWQTTLLMIGLGVSLALYSYKMYIGDPISSELQGLELKILYIIFMIIGFLLAFIKPRQELQEQAEAKIDHLGNHIQYAEAALEKSLNFKSEFLRNLEHEVRTPITGITSLGGILLEKYHKLDENQRYLAIKDIAKSSERLNSLVDNILKLSKISNLSYKLTPTSVNLSDLLDNSIQTCKKLYLDNKNIEFIIEIEDDIYAACDESYIKSTFDNLIINAIQYSKDGTIEICLKTVGEVVEFTIEDEGIGIPKEELFDIFGAFVVSTKTHTPAGGRGVGLALCKRVIDLHEGNISAESNGKQGATFRFSIPLKPDIRNS